MSSTTTKVLVTGASGFIASHVVENFLENGYHVVGTVRSEESAESVRQSHEKYADRLSLTIVKDIDAPGAFDEAIKGVDGVIHTASPLPGKNYKDTEREVLHPAIRGTTEILKSITKYNNKVKRVVITSSLAAIVDPKKGDRPGYEYSESDWNPVTYEEGRNVDNEYMAYIASKPLAEKAAFDFVENEKPNFSICTICPPMVYGPLQHNSRINGGINNSGRPIWEMINGATKEIPPTRFPVFVDVRDVALSHRLAYESDKAEGQRYIVTGGNFSFQEIADILREEYPELRIRVPEGVPGSGLGRESFTLSNKKASRELGMRFRTLREMIRDTGRSMIDAAKENGLF